MPPHIECSFRIFQTRVEDSEVIQVFAGLGTDYNSYESIEGHVTTEIVATKLVVKLKNAIIYQGE